MDKNNNEMKRIDSEEVGNQIQRLMKQLNFNQPSKADI